MQPYPDKLDLNQLGPLPCLRHSAVMLLSMVDDPNVSLGACASVLRGDVGLTSNVLRVANSAMYSLRRSVETVEHAAAMLGRLKLRDMALTAAFAETLPDRMHGYDMDSAQFWAHCAAVATYSEALGVQLKRAPCPELYTAGLLHDCGKLLISGFLRDRAGRLAASLEPGIALNEAERRATGTDHTEVGGFLAERWNLPIQLVAVARYHHDPLALEPGPARFAAAVVHVADLLAHSMGFGADVGGLQRELAPGVLEELSLTDDILERVAAMSLEQVLTVSGMFSAP
jgi:HD-like signal output (HDOD) protein